jgi:predicted nucleic acid-binding protein
MTPSINPLFVNSFIDSNIMHHVAAEHWEPIRRILNLYRTNKIRLIIPFSVHSELMRPTTPADIRTAAQDFIFTIPVSLTPDEVKKHDHLLKVAKGNAELKNIKDDLSHVAEAAKYGGFFITLDKRLLKRGPAIYDVMGVEVITPEHFLERINEAQKIIKDYTPSN